MSKPLRLFRVTLKLFEKDSAGEWEKSDSQVTVLTFELGFESARRFAEIAYKEADETGEDYDWRASAIEELDELFAIPKTERTLPRTE